MDISIGLVILFILLAITDLVVGVSNDAVNFLHSAFGSKIASRKTILWIVSIGLVLGCYFSIDLMDLTSKGLVSTRQFSLREIIVLVFAIMITDIIIIDLCNTFGIPTSTTTALIIEMVGATVALSAMKSDQLGVANISQHININHLFLILSGILISIFLAFTAGLIVQFLTRLIFTFHYQDRFKILLPFVGSIALTIIVYFISRRALHFDLIEHDTWSIFLMLDIEKILIAVFGGSFFIMLLMTNIFNINIIRFIVLLGTFALALSFASNDLVNFIGVPIMGIEAIFNTTLLKTDLTSNWLNLIILGVSGIVLSVTIFYSKKSRSVVETEVFLGRQFAGYERFEPSHFSRSLVRHTSEFFDHLKKYIPSVLLEFITTRYKISNQQLKEKHSGQATYFDSVRALVNLIVSTLLILAGTGSGIPLSTTFIVFLVAMGTSLADRAWTRESAVYRISGVLTILSSWFLISCLAFILAFLFGILFSIGNGWAIAVLIVITIISLYKSSRYFNLQQQRKLELKEQTKKETELNIDWIYDKGGERFKKYLLEASKVYFITINGLIDYDILQLKEASSKARNMLSDAKRSKQDLFQNLVKVPEPSIEPGHHFIQGFDYVTELAECLNTLVNPILQHIDNNHKGLSDEQKAELLNILDDVSGFLNYLVHIVKENKFINFNDILSNQQLLLKEIEVARKLQIKRIKSQQAKTKISLVYMEILSETKNLLLYSFNIVKSHRDFISSLMD